MFCVEGLHVEATAVAPNGSGFFSGMLGHEHTFTNEYIKHPAKRIRDAADQLSPEIVGVVVIVLATSGAVERLTGMLGRPLRTYREFARESALQWNSSAGSSATQATR